MLHSLERTTNVGASLADRYVFYFGSRPVASMELAAASTTFQFLSVDHLGTPILAADGSGDLTWEGGFEPFARDWREATPDGAQENGMFLRFPGQWFDETWAEASFGAEVAYNVHRWYQRPLGRYTRVDPLVLKSDPDSNVFLYANANPMRFLDSLGLAAQVCCRLLDQFVLGALARKRHCYLIGEGGIKYGLYPEERNGQWIGIPRRNDPRDTGGRCKSCESNCEVADRDSCFSQATDSYPVAGYSLLGPNSNTFVGTLARKCCEGGVPDGLGSAPGINDEPPAVSGGGGW
jgi:RHS repeat-associated protein